VNYLDLIVDLLNEELVQSRENTTIDMNLITVKNDTIVTLHLDDEERGSEQLAPYGDLHGDDTSGLHRLAPTSLSVRLVFTSSSSSLPNFLKMEYNIKLTATLPSMSILEIGIPSMWP
jgi:hypothetical protein